MASGKEELAYSIKGAHREIQRLVTVMMHIRIGYFEFLFQLFVTTCTDERLFTSVYGIIRYNGFIFLEIGCIMWGKFYVLLYIIIICRGPVSVTYRFER
jgi:hypothetical protein